MSNFTKKTIVVWDAYDSNQATIQPGLQYLDTLIESGITSPAAVTFINDNNQVEFHRQWIDQSSADNWISFINTIPTTSNVISATVVDNV